MTINFYCSLRPKNGDDVNKGKHVGTVSLKSKSSGKGTEKDKTLNEEDNLIPRLVANGTKLVQSWEDQYYVVNEYRANAHQVSVIFFLKNDLILKMTYISRITPKQFIFIIEVTYNFLVDMHLM